MYVHFCGPRYQSNKGFLTRFQDLGAGSMTTVDGFEPKIEGQVVNGGDWLYIDPSKQHARVNVRGIVKYVCHRP